MHLLHRRILKKYPEAEVIILKNWPKEQLQPMSQQQRLEEFLPGYPSFTDKERFFLFDEGQTTYWDTTLWAIFKDEFQSIRKPEEPRKLVYAILFCSHGNENVNSDGEPTPVVLSGARVTLKRADLGVSKPCGLLLDNEEYLQLIRLRKGKLLLADDLRNFVYEFTQGHVGAIVAIIEFLVKQVPTYESRIT